MLWISRRNGGKNVLFDDSVTIVVETLQLLGYYFGTKSHPRELYLYDPECVEIPSCSRSRHLGNQFRSLCGRFSFDAAAATAAPAAGWNRIRALFSLDAAPSAAASAAGWKGLRAYFSLDAASSVAASAAGWKGLRACFSLDAASSTTAPAAGWKGLRLAV